jgi:hypothetical protein
LICRAVISHFAVGPAPLDGPRSGTVLFNREYRNGPSDCAFSEFSRITSRPSAEASVTCHVRPRTEAGDMAQNGIGKRNDRPTTRAGPGRSSIHVRSTGGRFSSMVPMLVRSRIPRGEPRRPRFQNPAYNDVQMLEKRSKTCHFVPLSETLSRIAGRTARSARHCSIMRSDAKRGGPGTPKTEWHEEPGSCHNLPRRMPESA